MQDTLILTVREKIDNLSIDHKSAISAWILFLVHPVSALILAFRNFRLSFAKNIVWIFVAYYGFTMVISDSGMDANRYRDSFVALTTDKVTAHNIVGLLYQENSSYVDAAQPLISFLVSLFTKDPRILFAIFGLVFGYFYSRNIWFLLERAGTSIKRSSLIFIFVFAIIIGFWEINGVRMWTAAHLFFYGTIQYLVENKKKGIIIGAISIFFHFSFMLPTALLLVFITLPKKASWLYWFFILTFFISEIDVPMLTDKLTNILPGIFHQKIESYTSSAYIDAISEDNLTRNWRYQLYGKSIRWVTTAFLSVIYFNGMKFIKENRVYNILFCFGLFFLASINIVSNIPSVSRFYSVAYLFIFTFIFLYLQHAPDFRLKRITFFISLPLLLFYILGLINISFMTIGLTTLIGNPIFALLPFGEIDDVAIKSYLFK